MNLTQRRTGLEHNPILRKAEEVHGHLGPFLVIGACMHAYIVQKIKKKSSKITKAE